MEKLRPTMNDVARVAGVSLKTVSRVVNREGGVREELVDRVESAVQALGYRRNDLASSLRARVPTVSIGLVIEDLGNPFYSAIARGVELVVAPERVVLLTASSGKDAGRERELVLDLCQRRVNGIIIVPSAEDHSYLQQEIDRGLEVVFLDRPASRALGDTVVLDNVGGARAAVTALIDRGHRRIAALGADESLWTVGERLNGYRTALRTSGIQSDPRLERVGIWTPDEAARAAAELLELDDPPTAFFAENNLMTIGVLEELQRRRITREVAGFDDIDTAALFSHPLTLVTYDPTDLGRRAATMLMERLAGRSEPEYVVVTTALKHYGGSAAD